MKTVIKRTILSLVLSLAFSPLFGQVPQYMNYQGRLTNNLGEPITNISPGVQMTFTIWDDESLSAPANEEWSSGPVFVPVKNGFFDYQIGPFSVGLLIDLWTSTDHWLGVKIEGDAEISPRSKFASVPYAVHAATVQDVYVNEDGDVMSGDLLFDGLNNGETDGKIIVGNDHSDIELYQSNTLTSKLWGWDFGELDLYHYASNYMRAALVATFDGGQLILKNDVNTARIFLDAGLMGDASVSLPENAVNSGEILNEPGFTSAISTDNVYLSTEVMSDIETIDIDIPAFGYIKVEGWCYVLFRDFLSSGPQYAEIQIDETSGGTYLPYQFNLCGQDNFAIGDIFTFPSYVSRIYYKSSPGTYQFRLEGRSLNADRCNVICLNSNLMATYYPTAYTSVKAVTADPGDYPDPVAVTAVNPITKNEQQAYEIDLSYYELKAKEAKMKALEAELELRQAEIRAARENERMGETK